MKTGSQSDITSYSDLIERLQKSHSRISSLNQQLEQAKDMVCIGDVRFILFFLTNELPNFIA